MSPETIEYLPPQSLIIRPQVRKQICPDEEVGLIQSLREVGMLQPVRAKLEEGKAVIVDGHRRVAAALKAGLPKIPVILERAPPGPAHIEVMFLAGLAPIDRCSNRPSDSVRECSSSSGPARV